MERLNPTEARVSRGSGASMSPLEAARLQVGFPGWADRAVLEKPEEVREWLEWNRHIDRLERQTKPLRGLKCRGGRIYREGRV